ncbi:MAG: anhydro-N-acetylmuramic acid kinase [Bacteroidia bacterium]
MKTYTGIGLMSGSSLDGLDIALCSFTEQEKGWSFSIDVAETIPFDERWYRRLKMVASQPSEALARTDVFFGHFLGKSTRDFIARHGAQPQFVASHGQTIFHQPEAGFTCQIGDGESLVSYLDCPVVTNFRNKNLAKGGQGAPLVPFGDQYLFSNYRCCLNLGGISNMTYGNAAFDISPCNMALNHFAHIVDPSVQYDAEGNIARQGSFQKDLYDALNALPYYSQKPPKSLGAEWVNEHFFTTVASFPHSPQDILHTLCHHVAFQISEAIRRMRVKPGVMLITGGGFFNTFLIELIEQACSPYQVKVDMAVDPLLVAFKEALIFAFLGLNTLLGRPNILAGSTGVKAAILGGSIHLPASGYTSLLG